MLFCHTCCLGSEIKIPTHSIFQAEYYLHCLAAHWVVSTNRSVMVKRMANSKNKFDYVGAVFECFSCSCRGLHHC